MVGVWAGDRRHVVRPIICCRAQRSRHLAMAYYVRSSNDRNSPTVAVQTPREILDERFAKGEIEREEYSARRNALTSS